MLTPHFLGGKVTISLKTIQNKTNKKFFSKKLHLIVVCWLPQLYLCQLLPWQVWGRIDAELE